MFFEKFIQKIDKTVSRNWTRCAELNYMF